MPKVDIDTTYIEKLAELLARTGLTEIEICQGDTRIRVAKKIPAAVEYVQHAAPRGASRGAAGGADPAAARPEARIPAPSPRPWWAPSISARSPARRRS